MHIRSLIFIMYFTMVPGSFLLAYGDSYNNAISSTSQNLLRNEDGLTSGVDKLVQVNVRYPGIGSVTELNNIKLNSIKNKKLLIKFRLPYIKMLGCSTVIKPTKYLIKEGNVKFIAGDYSITLYPNSQAASRPGTNISEEHMVLNNGKSDFFNHWRLCWVYGKSGNRMSLSLNSVIPDKKEYRQEGNNIAKMDFFNKYCYMNLPILNENKFNEALLIIEISNDFDGEISGWKFSLPN